MNKRRQFLKIRIGFLMGTGALFGPLFLVVRWVHAKARKTILPKGTKRESLILFSGPRGSYEKVEQFPMEDVLAHKVFLAYEVNGTPLPQKHGFPLRVVAEGYCGDDWVKYVYKMSLESR